MLFPFAFHCTGMPIQAASNKLKEEISLYGIPPVFPEKQSNELPLEHEPVTKDAEQLIADKSKGKKSKLLQKGLAGGAPMRQWDILAKMVPVEE